MPALVITLLYLYNSIRKSRPFARSVSEAKAFLVNPGHTSCPPPTPPPPRGPRTSAVQPGHAQFPTEARRARRTPSRACPRRRLDSQSGPWQPPGYKTPSSTWPVGPLRPRLPRRLTRPSRHTALRLANGEQDGPPPPPPRRTLAVAAKRRCRRVPAPLLLRPPLRATPASSPS